MALGGPAAIAASIHRWIVTRSNIWADGATVYEATFTTIQSARSRKAAEARSARKAEQLTAIRAGGLMMTMTDLPDRRKRRVNARAKSGESATWATVRMLCAVRRNSSGAIATHLPAIDAQLQLTEKRDEFEQEFLSR